MYYKKYIKNLVMTEKIVGISTCIVKDNKKDLFATGFKSILPDKELLTVDTLYDTASLTKVLTVMPIICKLIDSRELSFDTKLKDLLPEFKYDDVTIYDILVHQSGLPSSVDMMGKEQNKATIINEMLKLDKCYKTGADVRYSDIGYILLGLGLERIYGMSLDEISNLEVFEPLQMNNTMFNPNDKEKCAPTSIINNDSDKCYRGVVHDWKSRLMNGVAGHAGVFSTANDLGNYAMMALNKGYYNNKQFISEELIDLWYKNLVTEVEADRTRSLCWITGNNKFVIKRNQPDIISFHGFSGPSISLDRINNLGIVQMYNSVHPFVKNKDQINAERPDISDIIYENYALKKGK